MKLKCIAALCKGRKMVCIHSGNNSQYVGDGSACYLVPGELTLDRDNVLIIFDVPEDKQDSWTISSTGFPETISMADVLEGEEQALIYPVELCCGESTYRIIKDSCGIAAIDTRYLAPLADLKKGTSYYIRRTDDGEEYIAVKAGLMLMAVIRRAMRASFISTFWTTFGTCSASAADGSVCTRSATQTKRSCTSTQKRGKSKRRENRV